MNVLKSVFSVFLFLVMSLGVFVASSLPAKADFDCMNSCRDDQLLCRIAVWAGCFGSPIGREACMQAGLQACMNKQIRCISECDFPCPL